MVVIALILTLGSVVLFLNASIITVMGFVWSSAFGKSEETRRVRFQIALAASGSWACFGLTAACVALFVKNSSAGLTIAAVVMLGALIYLNECRKRYKDFKTGKTEVQRREQDSRSWTNPDDDPNWPPSAIKTDDK